MKRRMDIKLNQFVILTIPEEEKLAFYGVRTIGDLLKCTDNGKRSAFLVQKLNITRERALEIMKAARRVKRGCRKITNYVRMMDKETGFVFWVNEPEAVYGVPQVSFV